MSLFSDLAAALSIACIASGAAFGQSEPLATRAASTALTPIAIRTSNLPPWVAAKLIEKSQLGIEAIRQYLSRTRMIHNIHINDIVDSDR